MKKKRGIALLITALMFVLCVTGCGTQKIETTKKETTEEKKLQIGLSFDSFVIDCKFIFFISKGIKGLRNFFLIFKCKGIRMIEIS